MTRVWLIVEYIGIWLIVIYIFVIILPLNIEKVKVRNDEALADCGIHYCHVFILIHRKSKSK